MNPKLRIDIHDRFSEVTHYTGNRKTIKVVDTANVGALFKDKSEHDTGDLLAVGENCTHIRRVISRGDKHWVIITSNNPVRNVTFGNQTIRNVLYPSLLMCIRLKEVSETNFQIEKTMMYAFEHMISSDTAPIYRFPFANVWENATICWGGNRVANVRSVGNSIGIMEQFLSLPMNNDLFRRSNCSSDKYDNTSAKRIVSAIANDSENLRHFPYGDIKLRRTKSYRTLIKDLKNSF